MPQSLGAHARQSVLDVDGAAQLFDILLGVGASDALPAQVGLPLMFEVAVIAVGGHWLRPFRLRKSKWRDLSLFRNNRAGSFGAGAARVEVSGVAERSRSGEILATGRKCGGRKAISQTDCPYHLDRI